MCHISASNLVVQLTHSRRAMRMIDASPTRLQVAWLVHGKHFLSIFFFTDFYDTLKAMNLLNNASFMQNKFISTAVNCLGKRSPLLMVLFFFRSFEIIFAVFF